MLSQIPANVIRTLRIKDRFSVSSVRGSFNTERTERLSELCVEGFWSTEVTEKTRPVSPRAQNREAIAYLT